jgi:CHAT domain-containing protein
MRFHRLAIALLVVSQAGCVTISPGRASTPPPPARPSSDGSRETQVEAEFRRYLWANQYASAIRTGRELLIIVEQRRGQADPKYASLLYRLAGLLRITGDFAAAGVFYERTLTIQEQSFGPNDPRVAFILIDMADLQRTVGAYAAARALFERALPIVERAFRQDDPPPARALSKVASFLSHQGDYQGARPLFERALEAQFRYEPREPDTGAILNNYAIVLHELGDHARARSAFERAVNILKSALGPEHAHVALALADFADLLRTTGDLAGAQRLYERALAIHEQSVGPDHPWVAHTLVNLAGVQEVTGRSQTARPLYERALSITLRTTEPESQWRASAGLGRIAEREGRLTEALTQYRDAVDALERLASQIQEPSKRERYLKAANRLDAYDALARVLLRLNQEEPTRGYDRQAWAVLEAKKGRLVAEAFIATLPPLQDPAARAAAEHARAEQDRMLAFERALRDEQTKPTAEQQAERVENLSTLLAQSKSEYLAQVQSFLVRYPRHKALFADQHTVDPRALAKFADRLPPRTLAIQYFAAPDALYLFVVASGGQFQVLRQAIAQNELYRLVRAYRLHVQAGERHKFLPWADDASDVYQREVLPLKILSRQLGQHLLDPLASYLQTHRQVVLIPNDLLLYLPIHALLRVERANGRESFLAETHVVSYLTQMELVDLLSPDRTTTSSLLALANPDGSLPAASEEIRAIGQMRPKMQVLDGNAATKAEFLRLVGAFTDLHLATHGVLDAARPEQSYLLLAGTDTASRRLTVPEIAGLNLRQGLVVLSACETGLGEQVPGAALVTLAAAFSQAGSQTIVASLWRVADEATREFMVRFYGTLEHGRAEALREAQLALLRNPRTAHPFYWAPFVLIGAR